jgi:hypothetical protein
MPKTSLPAAVVGSIAAPWPGEYAQADAGGEVMHGVDQVTEIPTEAVELRVALAQRLET